MRRILVISAWFGLVAGFGEGLAGLAVAHLHAPAILCVTLPADLDLGMSMALGLILWPIGEALGRPAGQSLPSPGPRTEGPPAGAGPRLGLAFTFFVFVWVLLHCWAADPFQ